MFRIDKRLVQVASPAQIPLIPVPLPDSVMEVEEGTLTETVAAANVEAAAVTGSATWSAAEIEAQRDKLLKQAEEQAAAKLHQAEAKAAAMLSEAEKQAAAMREDAWKSGFEEGQQQGAKAQAEQTAAARQQLNRLLTDLSAASDQFYGSVEGDLVALALDAAEKVVKTAIKERESFEAMIKNALKNMRREDKITVRVSEQQYQDFFNAESAAFMLGDEQLNVAIVNDPHLGDGDLLLESESETVNAGVDSQFRYISLAFNKMAFNQSQEPADD